MRLVFVLALVVSAAPAFGDPTAETADWYVGLEGGLGVVNKLDPGIPGVGRTGFEVGGAAVGRFGRRVGDHFRVDGQLTWQGIAIDSIAGRLDVLASTIDVFYDFSDPGSWVRPYVGVGLGVSGGWLRSALPAGAAPSKTSDVGFAYLVAGGGRFRLTDRLEATAAWHFLGTVALLDRVTGGSIDPTMHAFMVGLHKAF